MKNMILLWYGAIVDIPAGWVLCDGNNGSPDLRGLSVIGAGGAFNPGDTGGSLTHTHGFTSNAHDHGIPQTAGCPGAGPNPCLSSLDTDTDVAAGTTDADGARDPYHALCFIMKSP